MADGPELPPPAARSAFLRTFPALAILMTLAYMDTTIVATALPAIAADLGNIEQVSWVVISYLIATTISAPVYGRLGDVLGRRRLTFVALAIGTSGSLLCWMAPTMELLMLARVVQGLGAGGLLTLSQALIGETLAPRDRARYQGHLSLVAVMSNGLGPILGGLLTEYFGWRSIFLANLPVAALAVLLTLRLQARAGSGKAFRFDFPGLFFLAVFATSLLVLLRYVQRMELDALPFLAGLLATAIIAALLLLRHEGRTPDPLLPPALIRQPAIWRSDVMFMTHGAILTSLVTFLPAYYRLVHFISPSEIGVLLVPMVIAVSGGSVITTRLIARTGYTAIFPSVGLAILSVLMVLLALWSPYLSAMQFALVMGAANVFLGSVMVVVHLTVQTAAGPQMLGTASASLQFARSLGSAFGTALVGVVLFASMTGPEASSTLTAMLQRGPEALSHMTPGQRVIFQDELETAFRLVLLTIAFFAAIGSAVSWTQPIRRL